MSIQMVENELRRFLFTSEPKVLCISGQWGVGNTYAWNKYIQEAKLNNAIALERYSYVSLFGINSLEEFKYAIFENSVKSSDIGIEPSLESLHTNTTAATSRFGR